MKLALALSALAIYSQTAEVTADQSTIGITLNAGSNTAANAMAGFLRGFQQQKVNINGEERPALEAMDFMASCSGGGFPSIIYHYQNSTTIDELLDAAGPNDPSQITEEVLNTIPKNSMFTAFSAHAIPSLMSAVIGATKAGGEEAPWPLFVSQHFLQPFGIEAGTPLSSIRDDVKTKPIVVTSMIGPTEGYPYLRDTVLNRDFFTDHNENLTMLEMVDEEDEEFYALIDEMNRVTGESDIPRRTDLDFLRQLADKNGFQIPLPAFFTDTGFALPLSGSVATFEYEGVGNQTEPIESFDFQGPYTATYDELSSENDTFPLEMMLGIGTDLLGLFPSTRNILSKLSDAIDFLTGEPLNSSDLESIPLSLPVSTVDGSRDLVFTDGGANDYTGLPALLTKKPDKVIVCFVGSPGIASKSLGLEIASTISFHVFKDFGQYFGLIKHVDPDSFEAAQRLSHLFDLYSNNENQFVKLVKNFESLRDAGEPLVTTLEGLDVVTNDFWGIEGGWKVDVTFVHMFGVPQKFVDDLPDDIAPPPPGKNKTEFGFFTNEEFASVPNNQEYGTFVPYEFQGTFLPAFNPELPSRPARMAQILTSWVINRAWDGLVGADGEVKFGGFGKLLEEKLDALQEGGTSGSWALHLEGVCAFICLFLPMGFWVWF